MYIQLLKKCLLDNIYDSIVMANHVEGGNNPGEKASDYQISIGAYWPMRAHTMIGEKRLTNIEECFLEIIKKKFQEV